MPALAGTLPTSNTGGNNQTSPGVGGITPPGTRPVFQPTQTAGTVPSSNPYLSATATGTPTTWTGPTSGPGLYNTQTSPGQGQTDISKQLTDIFGKGIGGSENQLLSSLSGVDSQVFQQWLAGQVPAQAQAEASMRQSLGSMGVSGNSSVMGLAEANLGANFNATAAQENARLMEQNIGTTQSILQNAQGAAAQEVAQSPLNIASQVIGDVGSLAGTITGLGGLAKGASSMFSSGLGSLMGGAAETFTPTLSDAANTIQGGYADTSMGSLGNLPESYVPGAGPAAGSSFLGGGMF